MLKFVCLAALLSAAAAQRGQFSHECGEGTVSVGNRCVAANSDTAAGLRRVRAEKAEPKMASEGSDLIFDLDSSAKGAGKDKATGLCVCGGVVCVERPRLFGGGNVH